MVRDKRVKWDENTDMSKLSPEDRKKCHAAMRQRNSRQKKLADPNPQVKEEYVRLTFCIVHHAKYLFIALNLECNRKLLLVTLLKCNLFNKLIHYNRRYYLW